MSPEIQIKNPTFDEYFNSLNVKAYGELEGQYNHLWKLYCTPMKSCYCLAVFFGIVFNCKVSADIELLFFHILAFISVKHSGMVYY